MLPAICYTDASFGGGNSTPDQIAAFAAKNNLSSVMLHDRNSMSAALRFSKSCKKHNVQMLVGVELDLKSPRYAASCVLQRYWTFFSNAARITSLDDGVHAVLQYIHAPAAAGDKLWNEIRDFFSESVLTCSFFAQNNIGYRTLLQLCSVRSMRKQRAILGDSPAPTDDESIDDTLEDPLKDSFEGDEEEDKVAASSVIFPLDIDDVITYREAVQFLIVGSAIPNRRAGECPFDVDLSEVSKLFENGQLLIGVDVSEKLSLYKERFAPETRYVPMHLCRYLHESEYEDYMIKVAAHQKSVITSPDFQPPNKQLRLRTDEEIKAVLEGWCHDQSVTVEFWESVLPIQIQTGTIQLPNFAMPYAKVVQFAFEKEQVEAFVGVSFETDGDALDAFDRWLKSTNETQDMDFSAFRQRKLNDYCLYKLSMDGLETRLQAYGEKADEIRESYLARHQMEFDVIARMGFSGYFLIEYDFVSHARKIGVPVGDGRGSAAGSLIVYALEITDVDPIVYDLQFERFLNPERVSMPDIDVDFGASRTGNRNSVLKYISEKYQQPGAFFPSSSQIANVNSYKLRSAIPKVRAALGLSMRYQAYLSAIVKSYCQTFGLKDSDALEWDDFLSYEPIQLKVQKEPVLAKVFRHAQALTGKRSSYGVHAGGVVIAPTVITDYSAVECDDSGKIFCQFDKDDIELAGLVKFDILGLRTLTLIEDAVYQIKRDYGTSLDPRLFPVDDPQAMRIINDLKLADIFQLESAGMRKLVSQLQPKDVAEVAVLSALYRPGALDSKMPEEFVEVKFGRKPASYDHPALEVVTKDTYGCIVYQEQVMSIVRALAGYSLGEADVLRRAMGKKKVEEMKRQKSIYNGRAQAFWRQHYIEVGQKSGALVKWDVCLLDLVEHIEKVGLKDCLSSDGYFCDVTEVAPALSKMLKLNEEQAQSMRERFDNISYVVREFKGHYHASIVAAIQSKLQGEPSSVIEECCVRIYYALSQMVRFNQVFNKVEKFAGYGFNKSHALAYSLVTYRAAWLKHYYPSQFYAAAFNMRDLKELEPTVLEMKYVSQIQLLRPDVNLSGAQFSVDVKTGSVRYGLAKLKSVAAAGVSIEQERLENGLYTGLFDFLARAKSSGVSQPSILSLCKSGALDSFIPAPFCKTARVQPRSFAAWLSSRLSDLKKMFAVAEPVSMRWVDATMTSTDRFSPLSALSMFVTPKFQETLLARLNGYFTERLNALFHPAGMFVVGEEMEEMEEDAVTTLQTYADVYQRLDEHLNDWRRNGESSDGYKNIEALVQFLLIKKPEHAKEWNALKFRESRAIRINTILETLKSKNLITIVLAARFIDTYCTDGSGSAQKNSTTKLKKTACIDDASIETIARWVVDHGDTATPVFMQCCEEVVRSGVRVFSAAERKVFEDLLFWFLLHRVDSQDFLPVNWTTDDVENAWESFWMFTLRDSLKGTAVGALEDEYEVAGCYLTQTPAQFIGLAQLAEEEPAGTYLDGSPIQVSQIDAGCHDRKVSTWGMIRNVRSGVTKQEDSVWFNEKFMKFSVVSDIHEIVCKINGTKAVNAVEKYLTPGALLLISGKVRYSAEYGLSLSPTAFKRFYPDVDQEIRLVPKRNFRRNR